MHAIEKILAKASGRQTVRTGEIVMADVSFAEINDLYLQTVLSFWEMNGKKVWDKDRLAFVFDHYAPAPTIVPPLNSRFIVIRSILYKFFAPSIARGGEFVNFFTSAPEKNGDRVAKCVKIV